MVIGHQQEVLKDQTKENNTRSKLKYTLKNKEHQKIANMKVKVEFSSFLTVF